MCMALGGSVWVTKYAPSIRPNYVAICDDGAPVEDGTRVN